MPRCHSVSTSLPIYFVHCEFHGWYVHEAPFDGIAEDIIIRRYEDGEYFMGLQGYLRLSQEGGINKLGPGGSDSVHYSMSVANPSPRRFSPCWVHVAKSQSNHVRLPHPDASILYEISPNKI